MQFRAQGKKIQCIRSTYDPAIKRSHQKMVVAFDAWKGLPPNELQDLTPTEREELAAWWEARQVKRTQTLNQSRANQAGQVLADLTEAIRVTGTLDADHAARIWAGMAELSKVLRKAGHPKPKRKRLASVAPGQADLLASAT